MPKLNQTQRNELRNRLQHAYAERVANVLRQLSGDDYTLLVARKGWTNSLREYNPRTGTAPNFSRYNDRKEPFSPNPADGLFKTDDELSVGDTNRASILNLMKVKKHREAVRKEFLERASRAFDRDVVNDGDSYLSARFNVDESKQFSAALKAQNAKRLKGVVRKRDAALKKVVAIYEEWLELDTKVAFNDDANEILDMIAAFSRG